MNKLKIASAIAAAVVATALPAFATEGSVSPAGGNGAIDGTNVWIGAKGGGRWSYGPSWYARSSNGHSAARLFELNPVVDLSRLLPDAIMRCDYPAPVHAEGIILPDAHAVGIRMQDTDLGLGALPLAHGGGAGLFVSVDAGGMLSMQSSQTLCGLSGDGAGGGIVFPDDATLTLDAGSVKTATVYRARMSGGKFEKMGAGHKLTMTGVLELKSLEVSAGILELAPDNAPVPEPAGLWTLDGDVPADMDAVVHAEPDGRVTKGIQSKGTAAYRPVPRGTLASSLATNGSFTISARIGALGDTGTFLMVGDGSDSRTVRFRREGERILALIGQITNDFASVIASTNVSAANWMQLTVAYDAVAQKLSFYRDAMPTGSTNAIVRLNPQDVVFGAGGLSSSTGVANSFKRDCQIDDIRVFPSALSAAQVATVARMVRVGAESPPLPADCTVTIASGAILRIQSGDVSVAEIKGGGMLEFESGASFSAATSSSFSGTVVGEGAFNGRQRVWADIAGRLGLAGQPDGFSVYPQAILNDSPWTRVDSQGGYLADEAGARVFTIGDPVLFDGVLSVKSVSTNGAVGADVAWNFTPPADVADVRQICVVFQLPPNAYIGGEVVFDGGAKTVVWPETTPADAALATVTNPRTMSLVDAGGSETMRVEFQGDVKVRVQDDRGKASGAFIVRIYIDPETGGVFPAQSARSISLRLFFPGAAEVTDIPGYQIHMGERWIPLEPFMDILPGSALDMSAVCGVDAPAGRHGKVVVRGGHFEFEDMPGVPQRFIGAQISDTATSNIRQAEADRLADQIVRRGYNAVRLHHQDKVLALSSDPGGTNLNTYAMGRFDYLVGACISRGLYITTDLYASRTAVQWSAVGFPERPGTVSSDDFKYLVMVNDAVKRNFKDFARNFLLHRNPYTGRSLAEEPALIGLSVVNESQKSLFATPSRLVAEHPEWGEKWSEWIARKKQSSGVWANVSDAPPSSVTGSGATGYAFAAFIAETERAFAREMRTFIRDELGCAAPLTALNGASDSRACFEVARGEYDYVDWHAYVDHPTFLGERWKLPATLKNKNTLRFGGRGVLERAWMRLADRPVTATEWQFAAPGEYRAASGLLMGAFAAAQAYDGIWRLAGEWTLDGEPVAVCYRTWAASEGWPVPRHVRLTPPPGRALVRFIVGGDTLWPLRDDSAWVASARAGQVQTIKVENSSNIFYADPVNGNDENDGLTEATALKTLNKAVHKTTASFVVRAKAGDYNEGGENCGDGITTRVVVPKALKGSLRVVAVDGPENTFISGARDPDTSTGTGPNAVRCIAVASTNNYLAAFQGFTLRNGRPGHNDTVKSMGAALCNIDMGSSTFDSFDTGVLLDCVITNCSGNRAAAIAGGNAYRCRFYDCKTFNAGGQCLLRFCSIVSSLFVGCGGQSQLFGNTAKGYNCTIYGSVGDVPQSIYNNNGTKGYLYNCVSGRPSGTDIGQEPTDDQLVNTLYCRMAASNPNTFTTAVKEEPLKLMDAAAGDYRLATDSAGLYLASTDYLKSCMDIDGKPFVFRDGRYQAGCYAIGKGTIYVDAVNGNDANDGSSEANAFATLAAAMSAADYGDTVLALPGTYSNGTMLQTLAQSGGNVEPTLPARVVVKPGVTLASRDGAAATIIQGAASTDAGATSGCGEGAVRGVFLCRNATLRGFTVTDGHTLYGSTSSMTVNDYGGGVGGYFGTTATTEEFSALVEDCILDGNVACRGGGAMFGTFRNCLFTGNTLAMDKPGWAVARAHLEGCLFSGNGVTGKHSSIYGCDVVNCTILGGQAGNSGVICNENNYQNTRAVLNTIVTAGKIKANVCTNCLFGSGVSNIYENPRTSGIVVADANLDANGVPLAGSPAIDAGDNALAPAALLASRDPAGTRRVLNSTIDIGAYEYDWGIPWGAAIGNRHLVIDDMPSDASLSGNAFSFGGSAVPVAMTWDKGGSDAAYTFTAQVTGAGTLTVTANGEPVATLTAANGSQALSFTSALASNSLLFAYDGAEANGVTLSAFSHQAPFVMVFR